MWAFRAMANLDNVKMLVEESNCPGLSHKDKDKNESIHYFAKYGVQRNARDWVALLADNKAKFNSLGSYLKQTPLTLAAMNGHFELVQAMLEHVQAININKGDKFQRTPLLLACRNGHARIAALLLKHHASHDVGDTSGNTPLHSAAAYGWQECLYVLLFNGADPSCENAWKMTPITIALQKKHIAIVKQLLETGSINVNAKDDEGRSLLALLMSSINSDSRELIQNMLRNKSVDVNGQDAKGRTALFTLVEGFTNRRQKGAGNLFGNQDIEELEIEIMKLFLENGANMNIKTKDGRSYISSFTLAFEHGAYELLELFGKDINLNLDPQLLFCFNKNSILRETTHQLLERFMTGEGRRMEDETVNAVNE